MENRIWNNVSDCYEQLVTFSVDHLGDFGFPNVASKWADRIEKQDPSAIAALAIPPQLRNFLTQCIRERQVCFIKEIPEDADDDSRYFLIFGSTREGHYPVFIQMIEHAPDWGSIEDLYCDCPISFRLIAEKLPAIGFHALNHPSLLLPHECWTNHSPLFPVDGNLVVQTPDDIVAQVKQLLLINLDYWGVARLLDTHSQIIEYNIGTYSLIRTNECVESWLNRALAHEASELKD